MAARLQHNCRVVALHRCLFADKPFRRSIPQDWEEIADVGLSTFLRSTSRKSIGHLDAKPVTLNKMTSAKEFAKLKKRLIHAVERLDSYREADVPENEQLEAESLAPAT